MLWGLGSKDEIDRVLTANPLSFFGAGRELVGELESKQNGI